MNLIRLKPFKVHSDSSGPKLKISNKKKKNLENPQITENLIAYF